MEKFVSTVSKDARFQHILSDPRFKRVPKHERKIRIDSRFKGMFTDRKFKTKYVVDKRGRRIEENSSENLSKYYELSDQEQEEEEEEDGTEGNREEDETEGDQEGKEGGEGESEGEQDSQRDQKSVKAQRKKITNTKDADSDVEHVTDRRQYLVSKDKKVGVKERNGKKYLVHKPEEDNEGKGEEFVKEEFVQSSSEEDSPSDHSDSESSSDTDAELPFQPDQPQIVHDWGELTKDCPMGEGVSRRLAACNMDWDRISAQDLFVLFTSFKPQGGVVESVSVYPSDLGLQKMEQEEVYGPNLPKLSSTGEDPEEEDPSSVEALRKYQLDRLKYFYAVIVCDSVHTAEHIYEQCDGIEYEMSATRIDLRFIPDEETFDDRKPVSTANHSTHLVGAYTPNRFINTALQQTTVRLTWDETDAKRLSSTMKKYTKEEALSADLRDYLASSSSESDSEFKHSEFGNGNQNCEMDEDKLEIYKRLVSEDRNSDKESSIDMEISWEPGLKDIGKKIESKKTSKSGTAWEKYLEERKKKKKEKRMQFEKAKGTEKETSEDNEEYSKEAELELVMMDSEDDGKEHFSLKGILKEEKEKKKKKRKKRKGEEAKKKTEDSFQIDLDDSRFAAIYNSSEYAVDPSHPQYKPTKSMAALVLERQRRLQKEEREDSRVEEGVSEAKRKRPTSQTRELQQLVKSIKSKTKGKTKKKRTIM